MAAPKGAVATGWPAVRKTCREKMGVSLDPWQDQVGSLILAKRDDGWLASTIDGIGLSLPRQVGKTYLIASVTFALCVNTPGLLVIWTAQHSGTSDETFLALQGFAKRSKIKPHIKQVFTGSGDEEVRFHNGSRILFGAREHGFGRGIPGVDMLIFDEAQILSDKAMSNMLATMNTSRLGLHLYMGTPPKPEDAGKSEVFTRMRGQAYGGTLDKGGWVEFGADPGSSPDDRKQWAKANPSYPHRTPAESIERLRSKLTEGDFLREGLGIWDEESGEPPVVSHDQLEALAIKDAPTEGIVSYGVKFATDGTTVALSAARKTPGGKIHVELIERRSMNAGTGWLIDWLTVGDEPRWRKAAQIAVDGKAHAESFIVDLRESGVGQATIIGVKPDQVTTAHSMFLEAVTRSTVSVLKHDGQATLLDSFNASIRRPIGTAGGWGLKPKDGGESTSAESAIFAHWAARTSKRKPGRKQRVVIG